MINIATLPADSPPILSDALERWRRLCRAENSMPFADDFKPKDWNDSASSTALFEVFGTPPRFRLSWIGAEPAAAWHTSQLGTFIDEMPASSAVRALASQCVETVGRGEPIFRHGAGSASLVLPFWDSGRVSTVLVVHPQKH